MGNLRGLCVAVRSPERYNPPVDGIHDLGGRHGFGGSLAVRDEATFHDDWERRVFGTVLALAAARCFNVNVFRHALERVDPVTYLADGYFGRWLAAVRLLVDEGRVVPGRVADPSAARAVARAPRFAVGDAVRTRNLHPAGHTRLPGYARGKRGTVVLVQGGWVLPDTSAHDLGEHPEHAYAVRFEGSELWGDAAEPGTCVHLDCFESYLEPA
jgi:nitrile hydratase subunit beta